MALYSIIVLLRNYSLTVHFVSGHRSCLITASALAAEAGRSCAVLYEPVRREFSSVVASEYRCQR